MKKLINLQKLRNDKTPSISIFGGFPSRYFYTGMSCIINTYEIEKENILLKKLMIMLTTKR